MSSWDRYGEKRKYINGADTNVNPKHVGETLRTLTMEDRIELRRQARERETKAAEGDEVDEETAAEAAFRKALKLSRAKPSSKRQSGNVSSKASDLVCLEGEDDMNIEADEVAVLADDDGEVAVVATSADVCTSADELEELDKVGDSYSRSTSNIIRSEQTHAPNEVAVLADDDGEVTVLADSADGGKSADKLGELGKSGGSSPCPASHNNPLGLAHSSNLLLGQAVSTGASESSDLISKRVDEAMDASDNDLEDGELAPEVFPVQASTNGRAPHADGVVTGTPDAPSPGLAVHGVVDHEVVNSVQVNDPPSVRADTSDAVPLQGEVVEQVQDVSAVQVVSFREAERHVEILEQPRDASVQVVSTRGAVHDLEAPENLEYVAAVSSVHVVSTTQHVEDVDAVLELDDPYSEPDSPSDDLEASVRRARRKKQHVTPQTAPISPAVATRPRKQVAPPSPGLATRPSKKIALPAAPPQAAATRPYTKIAPPALAVATLPPKKIMLVE